MNHPVELALDIIRGRVARLASTVVLVVAAPCLAACDAFVSANGRVTDAHGSPIRGAVVQLAWGEHSESVETDSLGRFTLSFAHGTGAPKPGSISACKAGYAGQRVTFIASDTALDSLTLRLPPGSGGGPLCP